MTSDPHPTRLRLAAVLGALSLAAASLGGCASPPAARGASAARTTWVQASNPVPYVDVAGWQYRVGEVDTARIWSIGGWHDGGRALIWGDTAVVWFRTEWTVPADWSGRTLVLDVVVREGQEVYVDGARIGTGAWQELARRAEPGRTYRLALRGVRGEGEPGMIMRTRVWGFPAGYERWLAARAVAADLAPRERGLLVDDWRLMREADSALAAPGIDDHAWPRYALGDGWRESGTAFWLRSTVTMPDTIAGYPTAGAPVRITASFNREGSIWVDGEESAHFARDFGDALLDPRATPDSTYRVAIRTWTTPNFVSNWMRDTWLVPQALANARENHRRLVTRITEWDHIFRIRPDARLMDPVIHVMEPLGGLRADSREAAATIARTAEDLGRLEDERAADLPFLTQPYLQLPRPDGMTVRAESPVPRASVVRLRHPDRRVTEHPAPAGRLHRHVLAGLLPDTTYTYTLAAGSVVAGPYTFRTAPRPGSDRPLTIVTWGDSHYGPEILEGFAARIAEVRPDLILTVGDMTGDGHYEHEFVDMFLTPVRTVTAERPIHFAVGNHDMGSWLLVGEKTNPYLDARFEPQGGGPGSSPYAFSFDWGAAHIVFADPYYTRHDDGMTGFLPGAPERAWLEEDLRSAQARGAKWTIVYTHENLNSWGLDGTFRGGDRSVVTPLFERYGVDLVLSGHAHTYMRGASGGTTYVISGGGGAYMGPREWPHPTDTPAYDQGWRYAYHFDTIRIAGDSLVFTAHRIGTDGVTRGTLDTFTLRR